MEPTGTLVLFLILQSTVNKHHIRRVTLYRAYGTKRQACEEMCEFLDANEQLGRMHSLEFRFQPQAEHLSAEEVFEKRKPPTPKLK